MSEPRIIIEGYAASEIGQMAHALRWLQGGPAEPQIVIDPEALATWLEQQAEDDSLVQVMAQGSLDGSPVTAVMNELIRRARE